MQGTFAKLSAPVAAALVALCAMTACADGEYHREPPTIYFASDGAFEMAPFDTLVLEPKVIYDHGSTYRWTDAEGNFISDSLRFTFVPTVMKDYHFDFCVTNDMGADTFGVDVSVLLDANFDDIDNYSTKKSSQLALLPDSAQGAFLTKGLTFANYCNADTTSWLGFAFSNRLTMHNIISSHAIGTAYLIAKPSANNYLVAHAALESAQVAFPRPYRVKSVDIANDNFLYLASKFGYMTADSAVVSPALANDYYKVEILGLGPDMSPTGTSVCVDLVECSFDNPAKYYRCDEWKRVALSDLGPVSGLRFVVKTSLTDFPELFCIDNLKLQD